MVFFYQFLVKVWAWSNCEKIQCDADNFLKILTHILVVLFHILSSFTFTFISVLTLRSTCLFLFVLNRSVLLFGNSNIFKYYILEIFRWGIRKICLYIQLGRFFNWTQTKENNCKKYENKDAISSVGDISGHQSWRTMTCIKSSFGMFYIN